MKSYLRTAALVSGWFLTGLVIGAVLVFFLILGGCAGAARAVDSAGQHGTQLGFGAAAGTAAFFLFPGGGLILAAVAGVTGALAAILSTPAAVVAQMAPAGFPLGLVVWAIVLVLALRSWGHWGPAAMRLLGPVVKKTSRALFGGLPTKPQ